MNCRRSITIGQEHSFYKESIKSGESLCLNCNITRMLFIFHSFNDSSIDFWHRDPINGDLSKKKHENGVKAIFFGDYSMVMFTATSDTNVQFSTAIVPEICGEEVWYTNKRNSIFNSSEISKNGVVCGYFGNNPETTLDVKTLMAHGSYLKIYNSSKLAEYTGDNAFLHDYLSVSFMVSITNTTYHQRVLLSDKTIIINSPTLEGEGLIKLTKGDYPLEIYWIGILVIFCTISFLLFISYSYYRCLSRNGPVEYTITATGLIIHEPLDQSPKQILN